MLTLVIALIIDVMKPATLGFTIPGMIREYQTTKHMPLWFPLVRLLGRRAAPFFGASWPTFMAEKQRFFFQPSCSSALPSAARCRR